MYLFFLCWNGSSHIVLDGKSYLLRKLCTMILYINIWCHVFYMKWHASLFLLFLQFKNFEKYKKFTILQLRLLCKYIMSLGLIPFVQINFWKSKRLFLLSTRYTFYKYSNEFLSTLFIPLTMFRCAKWI